MLRAYREQQQGYHSSAQWYWIHHLWSLSNQETPPRVQTIWWDKYLNCERKESPWTDPRGVVFPIDHREILPNEIVFDIDLKPPLETIDDVVDANQKLTNALIDGKIPHWVCQSGGDGYHIHILYDSDKPRKLLLTKILLNAGLFDLLGEGKALDKQVLYSKSHMIRCIGGRRITGPTQSQYKTCIPYPIKIKKENDPLGVSYPSGLEIWKP